MRTRLVLDVVSFPLSTGKLAFAQFVFFDKVEFWSVGILFRVFKHFGDSEGSYKDVKRDELLFPPVFASLDEGIKDGALKIVGKLPVSDFQFPTFRHTISQEKGKLHNWSLENLSGSKRVGTLTEDQRKLERIVSWGYEALRRRIETQECEYDWQY